MNGLRYSLGISIGCVIGFSLSHSAAAQTRTGSAVDHSWDIAVIDRALAAAKPTDPWVKFGDVGIKYADLKVYRDRLAGKLQPPRSQAVNPEVVTPAGTTFKWPNGIVPYRFDPTQVGNNTITNPKMQQFRDGVAEWAAFANLTFNEFTGSPPANYITVSEIPSGQGEHGFSSSVGMAGGEQFVQFTPMAWNRGTVCHEVGHALGLWHEQQRPDRDTYVTINFNNIVSGDEGNFAMIMNGQTFSTAYDFYSIMHYTRNALTNKPGTPNPNAPDPTIDTIDPCTPQTCVGATTSYLFFLNIMGQVYDRILSKSERAGMAAIYGAPVIAPSAVVTNTNDSGSGSMRAAIYYAFDRSTDAVPTPTTVTFHIPTSDPNYNAGTGVFTIQPTYQLVAPGAGTTIDGSTQTAFTGNTNPNGPEIMLDGSRFSPQNLYGTAFILREMNCTVKNFIINGFNTQGILINGTAAAANGTLANGNLITGCYIGTDRAGSAAVPNTFPGIEILGGASNNTIGGTTAAARNVISGGSHYGISIHDAGTSNNLIEGNYIGLNAAGTGALPNTFAGVGLYGGAHNNTIGGASAGALNVISGNKDAGIQIQNSGTNGNIVLGNYVGLNAAGTAAVANGFSNPPTHFYLPGIDIFGGAQNNAIGGTTAGSDNVISGNAASGVSISGSGTNGNTVQGNFIGTDLTGTNAVANGSAEPPTYLYAGVQIFGGAQSNIIGGTANGAGNVLSGNAAQGAVISDAGSTSNLIQGNFIGTNATGTSAIANAFAGVSIFGGAQSNTIGGLSPNARNIISGNTNQGITISDSGTNQNLVQGNYIGTNAAGTGALPNAFEGVAVFGGAQGNTIGGTTAGARNILSGNSARGVGFFDATTTGNFVQGNYIGLNATGTAALANAFSGVECYLASNNTIGGTGAGMRNFISGNQDRGVVVDGNAATGNLVQGNTIGLNVNGVATPNATQGVAIFTGAHGNTVGGSVIGASNIISGNTNEGVAVYDPTSIDNTISQNSIFGNHIRGIGMGSFYNSSNNSQAAPTITSAVLSPSLANSGGTDIGGNFSGSASTIEFFASPGGNDEGQFFVGSANVGGAGNFSVSMPAAVPKNYVITATATDNNGNTSQFSAPVTVSTTADSEGLGIPDNWRMKYFGHTNAMSSDKSRATDDADGDGMTNLQEFLAGTDPKNPGSRFAVTSIDRPSGTPRISFQPVTGKTYRLEYRNDLTSGNWTTLVDGIFAPNSSTIQILDPSGVGLTRRFYRFTLEP